MSQIIHAFFADHDAAAQAVERLAALGVGRDAIRTFGGAERDHMGSFADSGPHMHTAERDHMGSFADSGPHMHTAERDHMGSFADSGPHMHTAERDHAGSFADVDQGPQAPAPLADELVAAGLAPGEGEAAARRIAAGAVLVLARVEQPDAAMSALGGSE